MNYPRVNRHFTTACYFAPAVMGSVASVLWHVGAFWGLFAVLSGRKSFSRDRVMLALTALLYLYAAAALFAFFANGGNVASAKELVQLATPLLFPFSYSIWTIANRAEIAKSVAIGSATASYGALILALIQLFILGIRPEGGAGNPLVFATVACLAGIASLAGAALLNSQSRLLLLGGYFAAFTAVMLSGSRSVWLAMAIASLVTILTCRHELRHLLREHGRLAIVTILAIAVLTSGIFATRINNLVEDWNHLVSHEDYYSSLGLRVALWDAATDLIGQRPLVGHGLQNTRPVLHQAIKKATGLEVGFSHFHNGFLTIAVESGLVALAAIIGVLMVVVLAAIKAVASTSIERRLGGMLLAGLAVTYVVGGSFNLVLGHDLIDATFLIFLVIGSWLAEGSSTPPALKS